MTKQAKLFNQKYNLVVSDSSFKKMDASSVIDQDLTGKPKKNSIEIFKRFFSSPVYTAAFLGFILIILLSLILPAISAWSPNDPVYNFKSLPKQYYNNLPPTSSPIVTKILSGDDQLNILKNLNGANNAINLQIFDTVLGTKVSYNAWKLLEVASNGDFVQHTSLIGLDVDGRDIWTRVWAGTAESLKLAIIVAVVTTTIGMTIGSFIGLYVGTLIDILFMKVLAIYNSIPVIIWYSIILFLLPPGFGALIAVFIITGWMSGLATSRMYMWKYVNSDFMKSAETIGVSKLGRIFKHALPHYFGYIAYGLVSSIPATITGEASLAFIGLSPNPDLASLGNSLNDARAASILTVESNPLFLLLPTIIIFSLTIMLHFVAIGVNDALEPKYTKR